MDVLGDFEEVRDERLKKLLTGGLAGFVASTFLVSFVYISLFSGLLWYLSSALNKEFFDFIFFKYLSEEMTSQFVAGKLNFFNMMSDLTFVGSLGVMYGIFLLCIGISLSIPSNAAKPFSFQVAITGFIVSYLIILLIFQEALWNYTLILAFLKILWIALLFMLAERLKSAVPPSSRWAEYFPNFCDGLFAVSATLVAKYGLGGHFEDLLSGPALLLIFYLFMSLAHRTLLRMSIIRALQRLDQFGGIEVEELRIAEEALHSSGRPTFGAIGRFAWQVMSNRAGLLNKWRKMPLNDLVEYYRDQSSSGTYRIIKWRVGDVSPLALFIFSLWFLALGPALMFGLWLNASLFLYLIHFNIHNLPFS